MTAICLQSINLVSSSGVDATPWRINIFLKLALTDRFEVKIFKALNGVIIFDGLNDWACGSSSICCLIINSYFFCNIYIEVIKDIAHFYFIRHKTIVFHKDNISTTFSCF